MEWSSPSTGITLCKYSSIKFTKILNFYLAPPCTCTRICLNIHTHAEVRTGQRTGMDNICKPSSIPIPILGSVMALPILIPILPLHQKPTHEFTRNFIIRFSCIREPASEFRKDQGFHRWKGTPLRHFKERRRMSRPIRAKHFAQLVRQV